MCDLVEDRSQVGGKHSIGRNGDDLCATEVVAAEASPHCESFYVDMQSAFPGKHRHGYQKLCTE